MKWIYRNLLIVIILSFCQGPLKAQFRLAVTTGLHSASLMESNSIPDYQQNWGQFYSSKTGFRLGVLGEIPLGDKSFFLQPGIFYSAKGNQFEKLYDTLVVADSLYLQHTLNLNYVELPLYLTWKLPLSADKKTKLFLSAGPYFAFIFGASQSYQNRIKPYPYQKWVFNSGTDDLLVGDETGSYKTFDIGVAAKAGVEFGRVEIGMYYSHGFTNVYTASYPSTFHNKTIGGSIGVWFNAPKPPQAPVSDTDKDGTPDPDDSCVTIPGVPKYHGCPVPDSDHDGIADDVDSCVNVPGTARYHGCPIPDSDGDGINNEEDSCVYVAGTARYHGCPMPDRDGDGIADDEDNCPDKPGPATNKGCPQVKAEIVKRAEWVAANVMFATNSTRLTKSSYPALRELADTLTSNPELNLKIEGHTDNIGSPEYNMKLSLQRAESVRKELIAMGVDPATVSVAGYGDKDPAEGNNTGEGRAKNRRVVFVFQLKKR